MTNAQRLNALAKDLHKIPLTLTRRTLRPKLRAAAEPVASTARANASWSTRIPAAITVRTRVAQRGSGVTVGVRRGLAPHGRPLENLGRQGLIRHPVHGHRDRWVSQPARPFLFPAADANRDRVVEAVGEAVSDAARIHGFT